MVIKIATATKKCRVCGKEYEACHSIRRGSNIFRWQEVACSPECGEIYLKRINASRNTSEPEKKKYNAKKVQEVAKPYEKVPIVDIHSDKTDE